jgi:hypothetical protein
MSSKTPSVINTVNLPLTDTLFSTTKVASIPVVKNSFLKLSLNVKCGPTSTVNIIVPGLNPLTLTGNFSGNVVIGSDFSGKTPFNTTQTVTIIFNVNVNETINVKYLYYKVNVPMDYKIFLIIFLIVFFTLNVHFK